VIQPERVEDERGFFARTYCEDELARHGILHRPVQCSTSFNHRKGTIRGLHWQAAPEEETKLIRCTRGAIYDVIVDLRRGSRTYGAWVTTELSEQNGLLVYAPKGCAHGFQTLLDRTAVFYEISTPYTPDCARGARFDDPALGIEWPLEVTVISERDRSYPDIHGR